jgi:hypothetical protein
VDTKITRTTRITKTSTKLFVIVVTLVSFVLAVSACGTKDEIVEASERYAVE